jgi:hypothetical protein
MTVKDAGSAEEHDDGLGQSIANIQLLEKPGLS